MGTIGSMTRPFWHHGRLISNISRKRRGKNPKTFPLLQKSAKNVNILEILRKINTNIPVDRLESPVIQSAYYYS
jgi:hypothetical protein